MKFWRLVSDLRGILVEKRQYVKYARVVSMYLSSFTDDNVLCQLQQFYDLAFEYKCISLFMATTNLNRFEDDIQRELVVCESNVLLVGMCLLQAITKQMEDAEFIAHLLRQFVPAAIAVEILSFDSHIKKFLVY